MKKIALTVYLGRKMQEDYGDTLRKQYKNGASARKITEQMKFTEIYSISKSIAVRAVSFALRGYKPLEAKLSLPSYRGLFTLEEMIHFAHQHRTSTGYFMAKHKIGVHGLSTEELAHSGSKSGRNQYKKRTGIHAQTSEEKSDLGRKSAEKRGFVPWSHEEINTALTLSKKEYSVKDITCLLNQEYHSSKEVRTTKAVRIALYKIKKSLDNFK